MWVRSGGQNLILTLKTISRILLALVLRKEETLKTLTSDERANSPDRVPKHDRSSKWHYRQRKIIFELIVLFIADTDTDENYLGINFS